MNLKIRLLAAAAFALALPTCTAAQVAYFLIIIDPATTRAPASCFQADTVPFPNNADKAAAEVFCGIGNAPSDDTGSTSTMKARSTWALWDGGGNKFYLEMAESAADGADETAPVLEGELKDGKYRFTRTDSRWDKSDEQRQMTADNSITLEFTLDGSNIKGTIGNSRTFACTGSRCASDFGDRCPPCSFGFPVSGRQVGPVEEEHAVGH
jgi:hypothetical protein